MRIMTWNVHGANEYNPLWKLLVEMHPDIALLQEVGSMPKEIRKEFDFLSKPAVHETGKPQKFRTAVLAKGNIIKEVPLESGYEWVDRELEFFNGNLVSCVVQLEKQEPMNVVSVHCPAWSLNKVWALRGHRPSDTKLSQIKLKSNPEVWVTEIVQSALKNMVSDDKRWVVGGDYNRSETFDKEWQDKNGVKFAIRSSGNKEILDRMCEIGFTECLRKFNDKIIPTFKTPNGIIAHQRDHLFVTNDLYSRIKGCKAGKQSVIFGKSLSDHLPIIADFDV